MNDNLIKDYWDIQWEKDNGTTLENEIERTRCFHSRKEFDGRWWAITYAIVRSQNRVLWWYKTGESLRRTVNRRSSLERRAEKRRLKLLKKCNI